MPLKVVASVAPNAPDARGGDLRAVACARRQPPPPSSSRRQPSSIGGAQRLDVDHRAGRLRSVARRLRAAQHEDAATRSRSACPRDPPRRRARPRSDGRSRAPWCTRPAGPRPTPRSPAPVRAPACGCPAGSRHVGEALRGHVAHALLGDRLDLDRRVEEDRRLLALRRDLDRLDLVPARCAGRSDRLVRAARRRRPRARRRAKRERERSDDASWTQQLRQDPLPGAVLAGEGLLRPGALDRRFYST